MVEGHNACTDGSALGVPGVNEVACGTGLIGWELDFHICELFVLLLVKMSRIKTVWGWAGIAGVVF